MTNQEIVELYDEGHTLDQLAQLSGLKSSTIWHIIRKARQTPVKSELTDSLHRWGIDGCAEEYSVTTHTIQRWISAQGIRL